jgi:hypothetical protein
MPLTIGILIIGSLYWRNDKREKWRDWRLDRGRKWLVKTPIRYGRLSRNKTYTMVFFPHTSEDQLGQAIVVPCQHDVSSSSDLIKEAEWLWSAEDNEVPSLGCSSPKQSISANWGGCVALMTNPESEIPRSLLGEWATHVARHYKAEERRLVDDQGILRVPWPNLSLDNSLAPVDLLLATSNDRDLNYPTVQQIADAWRQHEVDYFQKNRENAIETFEDREILALMEVQHPTARPPEAGGS